MIENPSPFLGKPPINDGNTVFFGWLGRRRPWTVLLVPIVVAGRTVGVLYADGGVRSRDFESLSDLVAFGARIGPAFEALLRARHRARSAKKNRGKDGTSPFARGYAAPKSSSPQKDAQPEPMPAVIVTDSLGSEVAEPTLLSSLSVTKAAPNTLADAAKRASKDLAFDPAVSVDASPETIAEERAKILAELPELLREDDEWEEIRIHDTNDYKRVSEPIEPLHIAAPVPPSEWIERLYTEDSDRAADALVAFGEGAIPAIARVFPGPVKDPFDDVEPHSPSEIGPLVDVLCRIGHPSLPIAAEHIESHDRVARYIALVIYGAVSDPASIRLLRPRLHDAEARIQRLAARVLARFAASPKFEAEILAHLRARLDSPVFEARQRAIHLLGFFRDPRAVPGLVTCLDDKNADIQLSAHKALRLIALQDFALKKRSWQKWWERVNMTPRIEWLLTGLRHKDRLLRTDAARELIELTGDSFGFDPAGKKSARERAARLFDAWWREQR